MKKIFVILFFLPLNSNAQQDNGLFYNCWSGIPDTAGLTSNILIDSQNSPWVVGLYPNSLQIAHKNNNQWDYFTCPFGLGFTNSVIDNNNHIWLCNGDSITEFDGTNFYHALASNPVVDGLFFDKYSNLLWYVDNNFTVNSFNVNTSQQTTYPQFPSGFGVLFNPHFNRIYGLGNSGLGIKIIKYDLPIANADTITSAPIFSATDDSPIMLVDSVGNCIIVNQSLFNGLYIYQIDSSTLQCNLLYHNSNLNLEINDILLGVNNSIWIRAINCFVLIENNQCYQFASGGGNNQDWFAYTNAYAIDYSNHVWGLGFHFINSNSIEGIYEFSKFPFGNIEGKIFDDQNSNGNYDAGEILLPNQIVYHNQNSYANSDDSGTYYLKFIDSTLTYNVQPIIPNYWQCLSNCSYSVTPSIQLNSNYDFGLTPTGVYDDVNVTVASTPARPGFGIAQNILVKNVGTTTNTPTLTFQFDAQENFVNANPTPASVVGNTLTWNLNSLTPFQQQNIQAWFTLPSAVTIGTLLTSIANVQGSGTENTPADNIDSLNQIVVGSFDPNEKTVSPEGVIHSGDWLTYTVYFQNTGTDTAFNVTVLDTLDSNLDFSTLSISGYSHPMNWQIKGAGYLKFSFNNILLPDSNTNEALSHGYVSYRIKSKSGLADGTFINNTAHIYFDFNSAVVTNTTATQVGFLSAICDCEESFSIFPTLISQGTNVQLLNVKAGEKLQVMDCIGRILFSEKIPAWDYVLPTKQFSPGMYFIQYGNAVRKLVVQ